MGRVRAFLRVFFYKIIGVNKNDHKTSLYSRAIIKIHRKGNFEFFLKWSIFNYDKTVTNDALEN